MGKIVKTVKRKIDPIEVLERLLERRKKRAKDPQKTDLKSQIEDFKKRGAKVIHPYANPTKTIKEIVRKWNATKTEH